jgi:hypothetical protein
MIIGFWTAGPIVSVAVQLEIAEWGRVHDQMVQDIGRLREEKSEISVDVEHIWTQRNQQRQEWELESNQRDQQRREWEAERYRDRKERELERIRERRKWEQERNEQRRKWEREREEIEKRRRDHMPFWGEARLMTAQCPSDRFRRYEARMYNLLVEDDWYTACMNEPIKIAGRTFTSPHSCINRVRSFIHSDESFTIPSFRVLTMAYEVPGQWK